MPRAFVDEEPLVQNIFEVSTSVRLGSLKTMQTRDLILLTKR